MKEIMAISLWRPWADWVLLGWKTIETRHHDRFASLHGKTIAIHAAQKWDVNALDLAARWLTHEQRMETIRRSRLPIQGHLICTCLGARIGVLSPVHERYALIECGETRRFGTRLYQIAPLTPPVPCRGRQGIFKVTLP